jgi:type III pantothenate kinase
MDEMESSQPLAEPAGQTEGMLIPPTILAINIGNTITTAGLVRDQEVDPVITVETRALDTIAPQLAELWSQVIDPGLARVVIGSVVADRVELLCSIVKDVTHVDALVIRRDLPVPMDLDVANPETVGVDRICGAAAAYHRLHHACVVADIGTAMTVNVVSDEGVFLGGAILPGPYTAAQSLAEHTAALPKIQLRRPERHIGRNTEEAILSGVVYGTVGALRELTERYATEMGRWPQLVLTGGGASLVSELCEFVDNVVPHLTLMGIALAWQKNPV